MPLYKRLFVEAVSPRTTEFVKLTHKDGTVEVVCHKCEERMTTGPDAEWGLISQNVKPPVGTKCDICSAVVKTITTPVSGAGAEYGDDPYPSRRQTYGQPGFYRGD
jgi:hypothetical protein